ncbi:hypothetical protein L9F63_009830, partial [Diploptera punctata]
MDIYQCIIPLYYASKIMGLTPFELNVQGNKDNDKKRLVITTRGILYSIFMCLLITISVLFILIPNSAYYFQTSHSANTLTLVISLFSLSSTALSAVIGCVLNRDKLLILLETLFEFETRHNTNIRSFNIFIKFEILIAYVTIILISIYDMWLWGILYISDLVFFPYILIHFIMSTFTIQYTNIIYLTYVKFKLINLSLLKDISKIYEVQSDGNKNENKNENVFELSNATQLIDTARYNRNKNNNAYQEIGNKNFIKKLRDFRRYHYTFHNICDEVNTVFGFQILFFMLSFFIVMTRNIYYSLYFVLNESSEVRSSLLVIVEQLSWTMFMVVELIAMTVVCHMT